MANLLALRTGVFTGLAEASGASFTDDEINVFINDEYQYLQTVISSLNEEYFAKRVTFKSKADEKWALPSDFLKMILLELKQQEIWQPMERVPLYKLEGFADRQGAFLALYRNVAGVVYSMLDRCIIVKPNPGDSSVNNVRMVYIPILAVLDEDDDIPALPETYHELLKIGAINRARESLKEPAINASRYQFLISSLEETITPRVRKNPRQPRLTRGLY